MPKGKGLADSDNGEFILNESGTSVSTDNVENGDSKKSFSEELAESAKNKVVEEHENQQNDKKDHGS